MIDFLRKVLGGETAAGGTATHGSSKRAGPLGRSITSEETAFERKSNGLRHFFEKLPKEPATMLDLGGLTQANVDFLSNLGCRIHAVDLLQAFDERREQLPDGVFDAETAKEFVQDLLQFEPGQFDAVMVWDVLEFLDSDLLHLVVPRLGQILRPGGGLLSFFHAQSRGETVQVYRYCIEGTETLRLRGRQLRTLPTTFNNRGLERLFSEFSAVKFFLTRDHLREVIATR